MDPATLQAALAAHVQATCEAALVEVHSTGLADAVLHEGDALAWEGDPCRALPLLRLSVSREGRVVTRYTVRPSLTVWVDGLVSAGDVAAGEPVEVTVGRFVLDRRTAHRLEHEGLASTASGRFRAERALEAGEPLTLENVSPRPDAARGTAVTLKVVRGAVVLTTRGVLLQDGHVGQPVRVRSEATATAMTGVLTSTSTVELR